MGREKSHQLNAYFFLYRGLTFMTSFNPNSFGREGATCLAPLVNEIEDAVSNS